VTAMTAAQFIAEVRAELDRLRVAHVVAGVEIGTDLLVGVKLAVDGEPYEFTTHVTNSDQRQWAFDRALLAVRKLRRHLAPSRRATPPRRLGIALERHVGEPSWAAIALIATCLAAMWIIAVVFA
jgi:hypothetical protein